VLVVDPMTGDAHGTILVADDSEEMRELVRAWLARKNHDVTIITAKNGHEVLAMIETLFADGPEQAGPLVVITDYRMPGVDGLSLLDSLAASPFPVPCIVMTSFGDPAMHERFARHGAFASFDKPLDLDRLAAVAADVLRTQGSASYRAARGAS
jgi:DNA-binding NtrC family response regulator